MPCDDIVVGSKFKLESPYGDELPSKGFDPGEDTYQRPPISGGQLSVKVDAKSDRLQLLTPFDKWDGKDIEHMTVLLKVTSTGFSLLDAGNNNIKDIYKNLSFNDMNLSSNIVCSL